MPKKTKTKVKTSSGSFHSTPKGGVVQKQMNSSVPNYKQKSQYDVEKAIQPPKIKAKEIFENNPKKTKSKTNKKKKSKSY